MGSLITRGHFESPKDRARSHLRRVPGKTLIKPTVTGTELKALRQALRLSQNKLAAILDVSVPTIKRAEASGGEEFSSRLLQSLIKDAQASGRLRIGDGKRARKDP